MNNLIDALWSEFSAKQIAVICDPENAELRRELKNLADAIKEMSNDE